MSSAIAFGSAAEFRTWLEAHHADTRELVILFYNKGSGRTGLTYAEAVDEALCFGWIDGLVRRVDEQSHTRRFTPRKSHSIWSNVNVRHFARLQASGRVTAAGEKVFALREEKRTGIYSFENRPRNLPGSMQALFRQNSAAWAFWVKQPPGYKRVATWWVISAKQATTRQRRLEKLIAISAKGKRLE